MATGEKWTASDLVFTMRNGTLTEPRNLNGTFSTYRRLADVRPACFHDLRHTCASLLHEQGADARMFMEVPGHNSIRVTMDVCTFVRLDAQRAACDRVGSALADGDGNDPDDGDGPAGALAVI